MNELAVEPKNEAKQCRAEPRRIPCDRIEHGLYVRRRAGDDTENLADRCLVVERFLQLALARLLRLKQPRVLDGDYGLVREGVDEFDLAFGERPYFGAPDEYHADCLASVDQRHSEPRAGTELKRSLPALGVLNRFG